MNNAGIQHVEPLESFPIATFETILRIMLTAPFVLTRAVLPGMYERGWGRIVHVSSAHGRRASPFKVAYVSAKHGLEGLSKVIALEGAERGVTSNCINPGLRADPARREADGRSGCGARHFGGRGAQQDHAGVVAGEAAGRSRRGRQRGGLPVLARQRVDHRVGPGARRRLGRPLRPARQRRRVGVGRMAARPHGHGRRVASARSARPATPPRWSSSGPVVEARAAGLPAADIEALDRAKRVALGVREQLAAHRRREAELAALFQTASDLAALTSVDDVLAAIVRRARALLGRDTAYLCLNDEERGDTYMRVTDGSVSAEFQAVRLPLGAGLGGLVAQQGVPIASVDYFRDDRFNRTSTIDSAVRDEGLVSIMGVPLKRGSQVIGVLFAADRRRHDFSRDEVALLSSLAAHAAVALDNARLLAETRAALISLEHANAALREQSRDTELAVLAHDRLAELVLRGGGVAEVAAELAELLGGAVDLQVPAAPGEPIGPGQSSVPVVAGSEVLGRLVLTRDGAPAAGGPAGAATRRRGDRAAAAVQPASGGGGQPRPA